jgi:hypothetical protein
MTISDIERNHYYPQQYLGAVDFEDQQAYGRDMRRRHNLGPHSWGIIAGLELVEKPREADPGFFDVYIMPGEAVDGFGREIVVLEPTLLESAPFQIFANSQTHKIWIAYDEQPLRAPSGGYVSCESTDQYSRIRETFKILVSPPDPETDGIMVGGITVPNNNPSPDDPKIPLDGSVSYQELPSPTDSSRWPVRLGSAFWDGPTGKFKTAGAQLLQGRTYAGLIGASVLSPTGELRLASRTTTPTPALATNAPGANGRIDVDADLVVTGDTHLWAGKLYFDDAGGADDGMPLWMQRLSPAGGSGSDLRIHIGDKPDKATRLTIGPGPSPEKAEVLAVRADDKVDIATGKLRFGAQTRQMVDLWGTDDAKDAPYGIGVQASAAYFRSAGDFYWFHNGQHDDGNGKAGNQGSTLMRLDATGCLNFGSQTRQMLNLWDNAITDPGSAPYGIGIQAYTLYARTDADFCWFRGGAHSDNRSDAGGGALVMKLDSTSRLTLHGNSVTVGDVETWGGRFALRTANGGTDTDPIHIARFQRAADQNDMRLVIGDNLDGNDRLVVGPLYFADGQFKENFVVDNLGNVAIAGNLTVRGTAVPIDVVTGRYFLNRTNVGAGQVQIPIVSRLINPSAGYLMVALSDIGNANVATDARWAVSWNEAATFRIGNLFEFAVDWIVDDIDGELFWFTYTAVFLP